MPPTTCHGVTVTTPGAGRGERSFAGVDDPHLATHLVHGAEDAAGRRPRHRPRLGAGPRRGRGRPRPPRTGTRGSPPSGTNSSSTSRPAPTSRTRLPHVVEPALDLEPGPGADDPGRARGRRGHRAPQLGDGPARPARPVARTPIVVVASTPRSVSVPRGARRRRARRARGRRTRPGRPRGRAARPPASSGCESRAGPSGQSSWPWSASTTTTSPSVPACDRAPDDVVVREVAAPHRLGGEQPGGLGGRQHLVGLAQAAGERLLDEHRLARAQREEGVLVVLAVRAGDVHGIHVGVGDEVGVRPVGPLHAVPRRRTPAPAPPSASRRRRPASGCPRARHPRRRWRCRPARARPSGSRGPPSGRERWGRRARGVRAAYVAA